MYLSSHASELLAQGSGEIRTSIRDVSANMLVEVLWLDQLKSWFMLYSHGSQG